MENQNEDSYLSSVKNALRIMQCFSVDEPEKKVGEIATKLGINKSTVSRTLATLASEGFVMKNPETKNYRLGLTILTLSGVVNTQFDIYQESQPVLTKLVQTTGETAHISILDHDEVIYLQKIECSHPSKVLTNIGRRNPPYCTSSGKVLLAHGENEIVERVISKGLKKITSKTIVDPEIFHQHLTQIKESGYAVSIEEFSEGVNSIAAPIYDYRGKVIAALAIVGPKQRIQSTKLHELIKKVIHGAMEISSRMGYRKR
ncbi:IclR family transcriptional regulator [Bacillus sp. T3]|uniref:IclR family transcriptional regulator n=1 Tax=Bacillus sp. T3 TaxID=467262 RepID=UPI0029818B44|nr:IclR family transcriptional regulator [Bacillus sp. T3]